MTLPKKVRAASIPGTLGERVRSRRRLLGMTQAELADRAGIRGPAIAYLEAGTSRRSRYIVEIAFALGCSPTWLVMGFGAPIPSQREAAASVQPRRVQETAPSRPPGGSGRGRTSGAVPIRGSRGELRRAVHMRVKHAWLLEGPCSSSRDVAHHRRGIPDHRCGGAMATVIDREEVEALVADLLTAVRDHYLRRRSSPHERGGATRLAEWPSCDPVVDRLEECPVSGRISQRYACQGSCSQGNEHGRPLDGPRQGCSNLLALPVQLLVFVHGQVVQEFERDRREPRHGMFTGAGCGWIPPGSCPGRPVVPPPRRGDRQGGGLPDGSW